MSGRGTPALEVLRAAGVTARLAGAKLAPITRRA